ncbi:hypothetical protein GCM10011418_33560 [Sphingobacterium alkalisoli]|uniref:hypothetical protein n=1 Tax=Sphingobacterium alkalisoli TaxID=1874115 RepID=UPI00145EA477|nr:hypothetical protein [Sphingobacterium alkalisoli]GGH25149.1 hypothetical protein GCM10011418_33560 [Sphingobacterium alkalisoli]
MEEEKSSGALTPRQAMAILQKHGTIVTEEEAEVMLTTIRYMVKLIIEQQLRENK